MEWQSEKSTSEVRHEQEHIHMLKKQILKSFNQRENCTVAEKKHKQQTELQ